MVNIGRLSGQEEEVEEAFFVVVVVVFDSWKKLHDHWLCFFMGALITDLFQTGSVVECGQFRSFVECTEVMFCCCRG